MSPGIVISSSPITIFLYDGEKPVIISSESLNGIHTSGSGCKTYLYGSAAWLAYSLAASSLAFAAVWLAADAFAELAAVVSLAFALVSLVFAAF